ncbi:hypothetical protein ACFVZW_36430 [Streptomyces sp. NPDC059567]|uniref:hypothetical protein n=1 Tax=Streptomyces sp. NPDC059567 TaxID=3346867 RepID=UPI0036BD2ED9
MASLAPFTAALVAFTSVLDYVPDDWFTAAFLHYLFAGLCALCVGLSLRLLTRFGGWSAAPQRGPDATDGELQHPAAAVILGESVSGVVAEHRIVNHQGTLLHGWSQYLDDPVPPTAVGTAYGLRLVTLLDVRDGRISRHRLAQTLLALQKPGGGWAASTQRELGRPEITAWVLSALFRAGLDDGLKDEFVRVLEGMLDPAVDSIGMNSTTVVAAAVSTLAEVAPASPKLPELARRLVDGGRSQEISGQTLTHWSESLSGGAHSPVHTARAVTALHQAAAVVRTNSAWLNAARAGVASLCETDISLHTTVEQLRRPVADGSVDALFVGHFTAAWVARAIMSGDVSAAHEERLRDAVGDVLQARRNALWRWHDGSAPIWMTYQGARVLKDYALGNSTWLR